MSGEHSAAARRFKQYPAYKSSSVEWLGEIPADWEVTACGRLMDRIEQGWSPVAEDRPASSGEWAVIKLSAVSKGTFRQDEHKALPVDLAPDIRYEIRDGDFLMTRANTPDLVGDVCVAHRPRPGLMLCDLVYRLHLRRDSAVAAFLDRETVQIDALVAKIRDAIDRLKELRAALISAAVTGAIDVREPTQ